MLPNHSWSQKTVVSDNLRGWQAPTFLSLPQVWHFTSRVPKQQIEDKEVELTVGMVTGLQAVIDIGRDALTENPAEIWGDRFRFNPFGAFLEGQSNLPDDETMVFQKKKTK